MNPLAQMPRTPARLSDSLHHQLNMYTLAATAAGVGTLAMAQPAQAKVVYTPAHKKLPLNQYFFLDLNHDGLNDFKFYMFTYFTGARENCVGALNLYRLNSGNGAVGKRGARFRGPFASALLAGAPVGKPQYFPNQSREVLGFGSGIYSGTTYGPWTKKYGQPVDHRYLGLRFLMSGGVHYGWARLNVQISLCSASATLTGYAYETVANKPIMAGETKGADNNEQQPNPDAAVPSGTLGRLALGRK